MVKIKLKDTIVFREENFGGLLYDISKAQLYYVNKTGFTIVSLLNKEITSIDELVREIMDTFNIIHHYKDKIVSDVKNFLQKLINDELIEVKA